MLAEQKVVTVQEFTDALHASPATVRRDISELTAVFALKKVHGGAEVLDSIERPELNQVLFEYSDAIHIAQKRAIAERAVSLCEDGESIIINGGTTSYQMVRFLEERKLQILTNSLPIANHLLERSHNRIQLPGGEVYHNQHIVVSAFEDDTIKNYYASKLFMGAIAINANGLLENDPRLIQAEHKLMSQADQLVALVDSSKFSQRGSLISAPLSKVDLLITDDGIDAESRKMLDDAGVETMILEVVQPEAA
jgi:DeoR family ulaG and ulaABCDEF operon transcriptional repressor